MAQFACKSECNLLTLEGGSFAEDFPMASSLFFYDSLWSEKVVLVPLKDMVSLDYGRHGTKTNYRGHNDATCD